MKRIPCLVFIILLSAPLVSAQDFIRNGYIIKNTGDTVRGFVHDKEWSVSPSVIEFQEDKNGPIKEIRTSEIKAFYSNRPAFYESHTIKYDGDKWTTGKSYPQTREPSVWIEATLFLETLVKSSGMSLYTLDDQNGRKHFFYSIKNSVPLELVSRQYLGMIDGTQKVVTSEQWKQQLINATAACPSLKAKILDAEYGKSQMKRLIESYNVCTNERNLPLVNKSIKPQRRKPLFGITPQIYLNSTEVFSAVTSFNEINFAGGVTFEVFIKKRPNRLSIYNELKYKSIVQEGQNLQGPTKVDFKLKSVRLINMIRFSYPKKTNTVFWNVGLTNGLRIEGEAKNQINGYDLLKGYKSGFELGAVLGGGTTLMISSNLRSSIELRYEVEQEALKGTTYFGAHNVGLILGLQL